MRRGVAAVRAFVFWAAAVLAPAAGGWSQVAYHEPIVMNERELAGFDRIFGATAEQRETARALTAAAYAETKAAEIKGRAIFEAWNALPQERRTTAAKEKLRADLDAATPDMEALRRRLLTDLRAMLSEEQAAHWRRFEYLLRQERVLHAEWGLAFDQTNLFALVELVDLDPAMRDAVAPTLEEYERALDQSLAKLETEYLAYTEQIRVGWGRALAEGESEGFFERISVPFFEAARRLTELNDGYVSRLTAVMPADKAAAFRELYERATLREAWGPHEGVEAIRAAPEAPGISAAMRERIGRMVAEFEPRYEELTRQIATIERGMRRGRVDPGVDTSEWDALRIKRGELIAKTHASIRGLLTAEQAEWMSRAGWRRVKEWEARMSR